MKKIVILGGCGYIGSSLYGFLNSKKYSVDTVDLEWFGNYINPKNIKKDFDSLDKKFYKSYEVIILLAGHSSVAMCVNNMIQTFKNNVLKFVNLLNKLDDQLFIYASSSGIYGNTNKKLVTEDYDSYTPINYYDLSKKEIDYYALLSASRFYGLRFGTVNGFSPNLRIDLMINKMYEAAKEEKKIEVYNPQVYRPILGIQDLCRAIETIIRLDKKPGIYNLASFNSTVQKISKEVSSAIGNVKVVNKGKSSTYDFSISTEKFETVFSFNFKDTVADIISSLKTNEDKAHKSIRIKI